jgi:hypothetical protein
MVSESQPNSALSANSRTGNFGREAKRRNRIQGDSDDQIAIQVLADQKQSSRSDSSELSTGSLLLSDSNDFDDLQSQEISLGQTTDFSAVTISGN